jgi:predicted DNA-binding protein YlxM (UPF0122 family)
MEYIPVKEYAELANITVQAVYQRIKKKRLEYKKIGSFHLVKNNNV